MIPNDSLEELRRRVDLIDLGTQYGVKFDRSGKSGKGLCPFHDDDYGSASTCLPNPDPADIERRRRARALRDRDRLDWESATKPDAFDWASIRTTPEDVVAAIAGGEPLFDRTPTKTRRLELDRALHQVLTSLAFHHRVRFELRAVLAAIEITRRVLTRDESAASPDRGDT